MIHSRKKMQDILFYLGAVLTCAIACASYYLKGRVEAEKAAKVTADAVEERKLAESRQQKAEEAARGLSDEVQKLSLEKDAALSDLKRAQDRFAAHTQYLAELDDRVKSLQILFAFDEPALDDPVRPFSALVSGSVFGGYYSFNATPIKGRPIDQPGVTTNLSHWEELKPGDKPLVVTSLDSIPNPKTVVMDLGSLLLLEKKGPRILRDLHSAAVQLFVDQRNAIRIKRFGIVANGRLVLDVRPRPEWWHPLSPQYPITERALPGVAAAEFESRPKGSSFGPCLRIDLQSQIPPRL